MASSSACKVLKGCQQQCHLRSQRIHSSHRYTYSNYMNTFNNYTHSVKVASFADIRAELSSYSVPSTLAKYTQGTVQNSDNQSTPSTSVHSPCIVANMNQNVKHCQPSNSTTKSAVPDETVLQATQSETTSGHHFPVVQSWKKGI